MIEGRQEEAVDEALRCNQFGLALFIASMCGREVHFHAMKEFANNAFIRGTPLSAVAMLHSHFGESTPDFTEVFGDDESIRSCWRKHLAALICNNTTDWYKAAVALGDRLRKMGEFPAAHFCYMISGTAMGRATKKSTKWTLAGCSMDPLDISLKTEVSLKAFYRTEGYEWAKRRANPKAVIKSLQPYKLVYSHLLVDLGLDSVARAYLDEILPFFKARSKPIGLGASSSAPLCQWVALGDIRGMEANATALAARLDFDQTGDEADTIADVSFVTARSHFEPAKDEVVAVKSTETVAKETIPLSRPDMLPGAGETPQQPPMYPPINMGAPPASSAPLSFPPKSTPIPQDERQILEPSFVSTKPPSTPIRKTPSTSQPPVASSQETPNKVAPSPTSAPANLEQKPSTPSSAQKRGMMGMLKGFLGVKEDKAVKADLGNKMEAYFDPVAKRWIFPGDDPTEELPSAGPPPTATELSKKGAQEEETKAPQDPLSAMMAPPPRAPRSAIPSRQRSTAQSSKPSAMPPAPPKFVVFTPKPSE